MDQITMLIQIKLHDGPMDRNDLYDQLHIIDPKLTKNHFRVLLNQLKSKELITVTKNLLYSKDLVNKRGQRFVIKIQRPDIKLNTGRQGFGFDNKFAGRVPIPGDSTRNRVMSQRLFSGYG